MPLAGLGGVFPPLIIVFFRTLYKLLTSPAVDALISLYHIPSFCGALYFSALNSLYHRIACAGIPILCVILFLMHPVGLSAWAYTLFWVLPLITLFIPSTSWFAHALGSTFTTHAVGSVLWLYTHTTLPEYWIALIPHVMVERLTIASCMGTCLWIISQRESLYSMLSSVKHTLYAYVPRFS